MSLSSDTSRGQAEGAFKHKLHTPTSTPTTSTLSRILWPRFQFQIAGADCTFPAVSRVCFGGGSLGHFFSPFFFLLPSKTFMNSFLCGEAALKASSVRASMCALYSCVCVYASASYGCPPLPPPNPYPRPLGVGAAVHLNVASCAQVLRPFCRDLTICGDIARYELPAPFTHRCVLLSRGGEVTRRLGVQCARDLVQILQMLV